MTIKNQARKAAAYAFATVALSATGALAVSGAAQADGSIPVRAAGGAYEGCPHGAVCIYPGAGWNGGNPEHVYTSYGVHQLHNEFGTHRVFNNQYGGATAHICNGSDGTGCGGAMEEFTFADGDLSPINSIRLDP